MKLALGTAQFGMPYGISNQAGKLSTDIATAILRRAEEVGVDMIDTARLYGDAEEMLGRYADRERFKLVTKSRPLVNAMDVTSSIDASLKALYVESVYGFLIHHPHNITTRNSEGIIYALLQQKKMGKSQKIGVSVYHPRQVEEVLRYFTPDIIQFPLNLMDQRFVKSLPELKKLGIETHARSVFLQGALLMAPEKLPPQLANETTFAKLHQQSQQLGLTPLQTCLQFLKQVPCVDYAVLGCCSTQELDEIILGLLSDAPVLPDFAQFQTQSEEVIDPSRWGS